MGNIWTKIFRHKEIRILMAGLDAAGKTTILYRLKLGEVVTCIPTIGFNVESFQHKDLNFTAWDVGCRDKMRPLIRHYYKGTDAVVIVIDSHDRERLDELNYDIIKPMVQSDELGNGIFLFLANKTDLENTMRSVQAKKALSGVGYNPTTVQQDSVNTSDTTSDKPQHGIDYCTRAYSAIKCLFVRILSILSLKSFIYFDMFKSLKIMFILILNFTLSNKIFTENILNTQFLVFKVKCGTMTRNGILGIIFETLHSNLVEIDKYRGIKDKNKSTNLMYRRKYS
ncbi:LOW QUALITY PROTEIN: hypothetical protein KUTeg_002024, partial [Tegillarca granosa]